MIMQRLSLCIIILVNLLRCVPCTSLTWWRNIDVTEHHAVHRARDTVTMLQRETLEVIPPGMWPSNSPYLNSVNYSIWGILQERVVYRSRIYDVKELKERLLRECRLLDHIIIVVVIAQWHSRLNACVRVNDGHFPHNFEPLTFCCVLFHR